MKDFTTWMEAKDIFGFEKDLLRKKEQEKQVKETPVDGFDSEEMLKYLADMPLSGKNARIHFNTVQWGESTGSVRVWTGTTMQIGIDKLSKDLEGNPTWVTKKFYQINRGGYGGYERAVAEEIFGEVQEIDQKQLDAPKNEYKELPNLVIGIASQLRRLANDIFIFEGIKRLNDQNFIIKLGVRGGGVEARDHQRVIENLTDISFNNKTGKIRVMNSCVKTNVGGHFWKLMPNDQDWYFMPSQDKNEIIDCITTNLKWY